MLTRYQFFNIHCIIDLHHTLALFPFYKQGDWCSQRLNKVIAQILWFPNLPPSCFRKKRKENTIVSTWNPPSSSFFPWAWERMLMCPRLDVTFQVVSRGGLCSFPDSMESCSDVSPSLFTVTYTLTSLTFISLPCLLQWCMANAY